MAEEVKTEILEDKYSPYKGSHPFVFISYSHDDNIEREGLIDNVIHGLIDKGYRVWYDAGIHHGEWSQQIDSKMDECSAFVVFLSPNSVASKYVNREVFYYCNKPAGKKITLIPIWIDKPVPTPKALSLILDVYQVLFNDIKEQPTVKQLVDKLTSKHEIPSQCKNDLEVEDGVVSNTPLDCTDLNLYSGIKEVAPGACKDRIELEELTISDTVVKLGAEAFRGCKVLKEVKIPGPLESIGDSCFRDCIEMQKLIIYDRVEIGERAFENCSKLSEIILSDQLEEISNGVFNSCKSLVSLKLPANLVAIGDSAFASCDKLKTIEIPSGCTRIDDLVFAGCINLEKIIIPNTVTRIGKNVFKDCKKLKEIFIPASVKKMDPGCFRGCASLEKIEVDENNPYFRDVDGVLFGLSLDRIIAYPAGKKAEDGVFRLPPSVKTVEDWAFADCQYLQEVKMERGVEKIGEGAFYNCDKIKKIVLPNTTRVIQDTAFRGCDNLEVFVLKSDSLSEFGWGTLYGCSKVKIYADAPKVVKYCKTYDLERYELKEYDPNK